MPMFNAIDYLDQAECELRIVRKCLQKGDGDLDPDDIDHVIEARHVLAQMLIRHAQCLIEREEGLEGEGASEDG